MKLNFILLAIVIAFIICYCFSKKKKIQEGQISVAPQTSGGLLNGYEDILIGVSEDYKLFRFNNPKKEWQQLRGKSCCVTDLAYWNDTLLGVGKYDHRLYAWDKMGVRGGLWKLATNLPMEWMQSIGVWKNKLFSANQQSLFRWTGKADGKSVDPFKRGSGHKPAWVWCGAKPNIKSIKEYRNQLLVVDKQGRIEMFVDGKLDQNGKLKGSWKRIGQPTEGLRSISEWNDKLMGVGTDNYLYEWSDERQNWFSKTTKFKLLSIMSLSYDQYQSQFNKPKIPFSCADGFKLEHQDGKRCYRAEGEELDWWSAYNKCKDADPGRKTTLAVISSKNEDDFVKDLMQHPKWIGCSDKDKEGEWTWPDGETLEKKGYSNWNQKEPSAKDDEHYCEQYESGVWNDAAANEKKPYVCSHTTSLRREAGGSGGGRKCTEHKDKKKNYLYWNSNKWPVTAKDKEDCKNLCQNDPKCPQADYYETGKRCYLYADNGSAGARRPKMTGSTPGETYFKCNTEAFTGSMKEGYRLMDPGQKCGGDYITSAVECGKAANELLSQGKLTNAHGKISQVSRIGTQGKGKGAAWSASWGNGQFDKGCWMGSARSGESGATYFNLNTAGRSTGHQNYPSICGKSESTQTNTQTTTTGYSLAKPGNSCQDEGKTQITDRAECLAAGPKLSESERKHFGGFRANNIQNYNGSSHPQGCFTASIRPSWMYWNVTSSKCGPTHGRKCSDYNGPGNHAVCKGGGTTTKTTTNTAGYSLAARGRTCQGDGKTQITSTTDCWKAHQELKKQGVLNQVSAAKRAYNWGGHNALAKGCFTYIIPNRALNSYSQHQYFNTSNNPAGGRDRAISQHHPAVCGGGGTTTKTSSKSIDTTTDLNKELLLTILDSDRSLNRNNFTYPHSSKLSEILNGQQFLLVVETTPRAQEYPLSHCPLYFQHTVTGSGRQGFSIGHATSSSGLQIRLASGSCIDNDKYCNKNAPGFSHSKMELNKRSIRKVRVVKTSSGRDVTVWVNNKDLGTKSVAVTGNIYGGGGVVFGNVWGWRFNGTVHSIKIYKGAAPSGPKRGTPCGEVPFGKGWWKPGSGCYQTCPSNSQQRNNKRRCICGKGGHNQNCTAGTTCKNNECVPTRGTVKAHELAGDYDVYYGGGKVYPTKRTGNSGGSKGLQITCDGVATQPGVFVDKVHTSGVASVCKDDAATFMIKKTHGANKWECLRKVGDKITGDHYVNNGQLWGTVEYRKKANQDQKYKSCQAPYEASPPSVGAGDGTNLVFDNITIGARKERSGVFTIKKTAFITKIVFEHKAGRVMCHGSGSSHFGCGKDYIALIIGDDNRREILPNVNVKGYKKTHHNSKTQSHWYRMDGVGRESKTMTWELKTPQTFMPGDYRLWYNEDLTNWTEGDNRGWATYKMTMTDEAGNTTKFKDQMLKDLNSGLCLGVEAADETTKPGDGGRVILSWCQRGDDKMWSYDPDSMQLTNRIPGVCAVIQGASKANAAQVVMGKCNQSNGVRHFYKKGNGSFYTENGKCLDIHSGAKSAPKKNKLPGSLIQWTCHGGKNQRFAVTKPPPAPPSFKSSSERNSVMLVGQTPLTIKKNNLLRMINAERDYRLEFTITPTAKIPNWSEIFHVTISDRDCCGIGDRMPGMWFYSNTTRLHIRSGGADGGNLGIDPPMELPLNKETTVVIELLGKFMTVKYSGAVTYQSTIARSDDRPYGKAKFYACSNWYNAAKASVKNVKWTNKTTPPLGKNAVMCNFNVAGEVNSIKYKGKDLKVYGDKADPKAIKTVNFDSGGEDPGKIIVDAKNSNDGDGCKTSGFIMSCQADSSNPWNDFTSNKTHWSAVGTSGQSFRDKSGFPCETTASSLSLSPKEGFRGFGGFREGLAPGKKIWASTGQKTVKIEGGPRLSPEVSCPTDFHGMPLKITAWGASHDNGTGTVQTEGGAFNIFNKDTGRLRGSDKIRLRPKQPKNGKWFADPIKERKTDSQGTLYLKTHMNPQWVRIPNDYRECFKDATELFVTSGDLGGGNSGEQCSGGLQYILHPKGSLCPEKTQIKTREECENAIVSLGIGKGEKDNYPWDKVLESKSPAGCSWTDRVGGDGPATARWNAWPNSAGDPLETYHPVCYSKPPSQAAFELLKTEGCHKCPQGTYSKEGSNECVVCTKNSTNKECREGGKDQTSGLVCPAGTSSTGAVVTAEGKPMNLGEEQSSGNNSSESLKDQCKAFNSGAICDPPCNNTHGRCVGGMCMCGGGYSGPTCDEAPKARIPTVEEWNAAFEAKKDTKQAQEEANKPETISYGYHEHTNMNKPFTDSLRELNKDVQELLVEARKQKEKKKKQRSFLPSEFLGWSNAIPGLLGKQYKGGAQPKPIDVGIAIDDRRKIHFRQQAKGKNTKLAGVKSSPQVISSDAGKITSGSAQDDLKGANSFKDPKTAPYRGFNDDSYLKGPNKPIQRAG